MPSVRFGSCERLGQDAIGRIQTVLSEVDGILEADFYTRKDFDPKLGLTVIVVGAALSAVAYWFGRDLIAYGVLAGAALVDLMVYGRLKEVTVCYRCQSVHRGFPPHPAHGGFDLDTSEWAERQFTMDMEKRERESRK